MSEPITDYSVFDLDGPAHKQATEETRNAMAHVLLKAMGLEYMTNNWPAHWHVHDPACSQTEQEKPHEQSNPKDKETK